MIPQDAFGDRVSISVIDVKTRDVVYSHTCPEVGGAAQHVAECVAKDWHTHLEGK